MIGVVGDDQVATRVAGAFADGGATVEAGSATDVLEVDSDLVVAVGEAALLDLVAAGVDVPVLPVDLARGLPSVHLEELPTAVKPTIQGRLPTREHPLLAVEAEGTSVGPAVFDAMLVRREPGTISEYTLVADAARTTFRADGVVVATPAGSHGYAADAGGPRLSLDVGAVAVVPVAAFGLGADDWVLDPADGLALTVARDEGDVSVLVDGRERCTVAGRSTVSLSPDGSILTIEPPAGEG